jgi:hypothetical protein
VWLGLFLAAALAGLGCLPRGASVGAALVGWLAASWLLGPFLPEGWHLERTAAGLAGGLGAYLLARRLPARLATLRRSVLLHASAKRR